MLLENRCTCQIKDIMLLTVGLISYGLKNLYPPDGKGLGRNPVLPQSILILIFSS